MLKAGFLDSRGGGGKKKNDNSEVLIGSCLGYEFPSLSVSAGRYILRMEVCKRGIMLPLASIHEVNDRMKNALYGYFIGKRLAFPVVECLLKEELSRIPVWVKFHDVMSVAYTSDELSLIAMKIGTPMIDNLVITVPNLEGLGYTKEIIHVEYE
nr:hypothetical protein [Tanacetum cinerariifolium]